MKALVYVLKTTIINYFKRIKEKPTKAIGPIAVALWMIVMFLPKRSSRGTSTSPEIFVSIFVGITIAAFLLSLYSGTKKVDSKFNMCDVNLIFVSPIRPQTVMIYGIIKKIAVELLASFYLLYQIPNFLRSFNVPGINQFMLGLSYVLFQLVLCNIIKLFVFALETKYKDLGTIIRSVIKGIMLLTAAGTAMLVVKGNIVEFAKDVASLITYTSWVKYIPVFGWMREIAIQTILGIKPSYGIYIALILITSGLLVYIIYNMEMDFYEDMLSSAEHNDLAKNIASGKEVPMDGKRSFLFKPFKKVSLKLEGVYGAKVLYFKHMNEYFKRSFIFFINTYSLIVLVISIILGLYAKGMNIKLVFLIASVLLFFGAGMGGKIYGEIDRYFIFLLPDSPQKKLFYGIASSLIKIFSDAILLFLPFGILSGTSMLEIFLCILCYFLLGGMLSYSGLFAFRVAQFFGFTGAVAQGMFFMFFQMLLIVPIFVAVLFLTSVFTNLSGYGVYPAFIIYSIAAAILFSFGCTGVFNDMELWK